MSQQDVLKAAGAAQNPSTMSVYSFGVHEQWVYGSGNYLHFENGILTSLQTSR
jgi:hypothetical protein